MRRWTTILLAVACTACAAPWPPHTGAKPNVLFLAIDDLNDWVSCLGGHPQVKTPNLDRLAARGTLFTNAHCQAPICTPSRISMLTGRLPSSTGYYLLSPSNFRASPQLKDVRTLPEAFAAGGYRTLGAGKIFHAGGHQKTFHRYGPRGNMGPLPKQKRHYKTGHRLWDWGAFPDDDAAMPDVAIADWAIAQLRQRHDKPFFLAAGFLRPHVPLYVPKKWWDGTPSQRDVLLPQVLVGDRNDIPEYAKRLTLGHPAPRQEWFEQHPGQWQRAVRGYLACIQFVDAQIGRVLDALAASPYADNTILVLCSDHGFHMGEKRRWAKRSLWTRSTRVPMVIALPAGHRPARSRRPVGLIDLYPTLVELCRLPITPGLEGQSLVPLLRDADARWDRPALTTLYKGNHTLRSTRWRYTRYSDGAEELYDLDADPHEWHNLAGKPEHAAVIARLARHLPATNAEPVAGSRGLGSPSIVQ